MIFLHRIRTALIKESRPYLSMLRQRVFGLIASYEDLNDHHELRNDPLIQTVVGRSVSMIANFKLKFFQLPEISSVKEL